MLYKSHRSGLNRRPLGDESERASLYVPATAEDSGPVGGMEPGRGPPMTPGGGGATGGSTTGR